jgi:hypothetical protein
MQNQINLGPISQFAQLLRSAELAQNKEIKMPIQQARMLSLALNEIQDKLLQDYETMFNQLRKSVDNGVVSIEIDGGSFKE